jgi:hypothetical protein
MKYLKLLGFLIAVFIATAIIGTRSAAPTALCSDEPKGGACGSPYGITKIEGKSTGAELKTPIGTIACFSGGTFIGETTEKQTGEGKPLKGTVTQMPFALCKLGITSCTVESVNRPYVALLSWTSGTKGDLEFESSGVGTPGISILCGASIDCTYPFTSPIQIEGPSVVFANKATLGAGSGKNCPKSEAAVTWSTGYQLFKAFYVANYAAQDKLCKKNESPCPGEETYGSSTALAAALETGSAAKFKLKISEESVETEYTVPCESSVLEGKTTAAGGLPLPAEITTLTFAECGGTCAIKALKLNYKAEVEATGGGNGSIRMLTGSGGGTPRLEVRCIGAYKCTYEASSIQTSATGGAPAKLSVNATLNKVAGESDAKCGSQLKWEGSYKFTKPEASGEAKMWLIREAI